MKVRIFVIMMCIALAVGVAACGSPTATVTPASTPKPVLGDNVISHLAVAAQSGTFHYPLDATPDLDGTSIYFTASGGLHGAGVFRVPSAGGTVTEVFTGKPFVAPRSLALSPDGKVLYVADLQAQSAGGTGQIFVLPIGGGSPVVLPGSVGTAPQNLEVVNQAGQQMVYFTGKDPSSGQPAVLTLPALGARGARGAGAPMVIVKGAPLVDPDGVVVTGSGVIYVSDRSAAGGGFGKVFKIDGSVITAIVEKVLTGDPAGIALSPDESILLASGVQFSTPSAEVLLVDLSTLQTGLVTKVIAQNQGSGGLHASPGKKDIFAWAGFRGGGSGSVYQIESA